MQSSTVPQRVGWQVENGLKELGLLLRVVLCHHSEPILIANSDRNVLDANSAAGRLLGLSTDQIIGRRMDDFAEPSFRPQLEHIWRAFLEQGEHEGTLSLTVSGRVVRPVDFIARGSVLPIRHLVVLHNKSTEKSGEDPVCSWVKDYACFLLDPDGRVAAWYSGAERIYGYKENEIIGQGLSCLYPAELKCWTRMQEELKRADAEDHFGNEGWHSRKDGARFWANVLTMAIKDENGELRGYARVVRDFSRRHHTDEALRQRRAHYKRAPAEPTVAGIVSGEFDRMTEASDAFLRMVGYRREDLLGGQLHWSDLTPAEYSPRDEKAHEEALRHGACTPFEKEYIRKDGSRIPVLVSAAVLSLSPFRWITFVQDLSERQPVGTIEAGRYGGHDFAEFVGRSSAMKRVLRQAELVAPTDATVLLLGETGTGKELVANAIHRISTRSKFPFITLNCAAIPTGLLESELFGYEKGAFTGALSQKVGRFELAHYGTLFLDEVGDIPLELQPKLLRALQEKEFERLGGTRTIPIDVRLIAATNRNLKQMMGDKLFRSDLYYRLKVFPITIPPLRDHPEDIPVLARHFTQKYAREMNKQIDTIPYETIRALETWSWPGNVRELQNFIERAVILSPDPKLRAPLDELRADAMEAPGGATLAQMEREYIVRVLRETGGVVSAAAVRLGLPRTTLNAMLRKLRISREDASL